MVLCYYACGCPGYRDATPGVIDRSSLRGGAGVEGYFWKPEPVALVRILVRKASAQM